MKAAVVGGIVVGGVGVDGVVVGGAPVFAVVPMRLQHQMNQLGIRAA